VTDYDDPRELARDDEPRLTLKQLLNTPFGTEPIESYTCYDCPLWQKCEFAFDGYNTDGDCLAEK
jgi:hypothetical protein